MSSGEFFARKASGLVRQISAADALMINTLLMGINLPFTYAVWSAALFPGVNLVLSNLIAAPLVFILAMTWLFFTLTMPRAGADFVWVSRSLHPALGFVDSLPLVLFVFSWSGGVGPAFHNPGVAGMLASFGVITKNQSYIDAIPYWTSPNVSFALMILCLAVSLIVIAAGTKTTLRFSWITYAIVLIGTFAYCGLMLSVGHEGFVARFNELSGLNYDAVIEAARSSGYNPGFTTAGTITGVVYFFLNYYGFAWCSYFAGEMKEFRRSNIVAIVGAVIIFAALTGLQYWVTYAVAGSEFFHAASSLALTGNSAWNLPMAPWLTYLVVFATDNPWLAAIVGFSLVVEVYATLVTYWMLTTRVIFAWSFDRLIPTAFSAVDQRFHAPRNALILTGIICAIFLYLAYFTTAMSFLSYGTMGVYTAASIVGVSAIAFPYRRKDIFEKAPKLVQTKVGGVPVMSMLGLCTLVIGVSVATFTALPSFTGAPVNPYYVSAVLLTFVAAFVYYLFASWYNSRRGLDMSVAYRELPPL